MTCLVAGPTGARGQHRLPGTEATTGPVKVVKPDTVIASAPAGSGTIDDILTSALKASFDDALEIDAEL